MTDENDLPEQQEHIEYLELREVWKSIGLTLRDQTLKLWAEHYPVNIAVLDSGVDGTHEAFRSLLPHQPSDQPKVINSNPGSDETGHGTFCAGVAAGYPIPSPVRPVDPEFENRVESYAELHSLQDSKDKIKDILQQLSGCHSEIRPFTGVAPFANIISYKVIDNNGDLDENVLARALENVLAHNEKEEFKKQVHIVSMSLSACYNDDVRKAIYKLLNQDIIIVAAACNMGQKSNYCHGNIWFPARFGNVISVGSHDIFGQPSKLSSVGREVDFLAPGEEIWGPSSSSSENGIGNGIKNVIEKDEGTSLSAAIVSGIVALVLAYVHKARDRDARSNISNNSVMREILRKMATRGQHNEVVGYGSLKPLKVFGYDAHVLWDLIKNVVPNHNLGTAAVSQGTSAVSHFILCDTVHPFGMPDKMEIHNLSTNIKQETYKEDYHEDIDNSDIKELCESRIERALGYLCRRKLTREVKEINLILPELPKSRVDRRKLVLCGTILSVINGSGVLTVQQLVLPEVHHFYPKDVCLFLKILPKDILKQLKVLVIPGKYQGIWSGVLRRIVQIIEQVKAEDKTNPRISIYVESIHSGGNKPDLRYVEECRNVHLLPSVGLLERIKQTGFMPLDQPDENEIHQPDENEIHQPDANEIHQPDENEIRCVDEIRRHPSNVNTASEFYPPLPNQSLHQSVHQAQASISHKVTVAILGDAIDIYHNEIKGKIDLSSPNDLIRSFTDPPGGPVEKGRHLGTLCASIIAGKHQGIAPFVNLVYATVINARGMTKLEWVIDALNWIKSKHSNVDLVVIPLGFDKPSSSLFRIINELSEGMVVICAASARSGAIRPKIAYPARYGDVISVGSHSGMFQPSLFSPQGREIDALALGENLGSEPFSPPLIPRGQNLQPHGDSSHYSTDERSGVSSLETTRERIALSGTCVAAACAAGVVAQLVSLGLQRGYKRGQIVNNTVVRELLKHLTGNFSHDPQIGHGFLSGLSGSLLLRNEHYFRKVLDEILRGHR